MKPIRTIIYILVLLLSHNICVAATTVPDSNEKEQRSSENEQQRCAEKEQQRRATYYYLAAQTQKDKGNYSAMVDLLQHCLRIAPNHAAANYDLAYIRFQMQRDSSALANLQRAVEYDPNNPWYLESLATAYLHMRKPDNAIPILEHMAKLQSKRTDIPAELFQLYKQTGRTDDAINALDRIQTLQGNNARIAAQKFALYIDKNDTIKAFQTLHELCKEYPYDATSLMLLAQNYLDMIHTDSAQMIFQKVERLDPQNRHLQTARLQYLLATKDTTAFRAQCDSIVLSTNIDPSLQQNILGEMISEAVADSTRRPHCDSIFNILISTREKPAIPHLELFIAYRTYVYHDDNEKIVPILRRILEIDPSNIEFIQAMMQYHLQKNDAVAIKELCQQSLIYHPSELTFHYFLGMACAQLKLNNEATKALTTAIRQTNEESNPLMVGDIYGLLGDMLHEQGKEKEAFQAYDSCLVYTPDNAGCLNNYAYFLSLKDKQLERAEEMSYRAVKAEPKNKTYIDTYAWVLFMCKDYTTARSYMDKVVDPSLPDSTLLADEELTNVLIEHAGDIYWHLDDKEQALRLWQLAAKKSKPSAILRKKIKKKKYIANPKK